MKPNCKMPGILFHALHRAHQKRAQAQLNAGGLEDLGSPPMLFLIRHWSEQGKLASQKELADALHVTPATVAMSLKSLERSGYVEKRGDPSDQRCKRIAITPKGSRALRSWGRWMSRCSTGSPPKNRSSSTATTAGCSATSAAVIFKARMTSVRKGWNKKVCFENCFHTWVSTRNTPYSPR